MLLQDLKIFYKHQLQNSTELVHSQVPELCSESVYIVLY